MRSFLYSHSSHAGFLSILVFVALWPEGAHSQTFAPSSGSPFAIDSIPFSIVTGDFNGDGKLDLATANGNGITVLLGNGTGGFTSAPGSPFVVGSTNGRIVIGDFNGDGKLDLAISSSGSKVIVLLGNGTGGFTSAPGSPFAAGSDPGSIAVGDFNGDGKLDVVTASVNNSNVTVWLGNGAGGFTQASGSPSGVGSEPIWISVGDFNGDNKPDLATANFGDSTVTILLGNGTGGFTRPSRGLFAMGVSPYSIAISDFNGDGKLDLATANYLITNNVTVWLGNGTGGFTQPAGSPFAVGSSPRFIAAGDFNGDGKSDLITANRLDNNGITMWLGNGTGGFTQAPGSPFALGSNPESIVVGDFNGDGKPDLAITNTFSSNVTVLLNITPTLTANPASVTFYGVAGQATSEVIPVSVSSTPAGSTYTVISDQSFVTANLTANSTDGTSIINLTASAVSLGAGTYSATVRYSAPGYYGAATAVTFNVANPSGELKPTSSGPFAVGLAPESVAVGDFNRDGNLDLATANYGSNTVTVLLGNGAGGFAPALGNPFAVGSNPTFIALGDFNGDGKLDLATANETSNNVTVLLGNGTGEFTPAPGNPFAVGSLPSSITLGDFNRDGRLDLATANYGSNNITVLLSNGAGGFTPVTDSPFAVGLGIEAVVAGDFNRDGKLDLVTTNYFSNNITVFLGNGIGGFTASSGSSFAVGSQPGSIAVGDFNRDGKLDLATANMSSNNVTVLLGNGTGGFTQVPGNSFSVGGEPISITVGDFNGDGKPDLVTANLSDNNVTVLLGNGVGGFTSAPGSPYATGTGSRSVAIGDFNGDGRVDLATANYGGNNVTVLLGGIATTATLSTTPTAPISVGKGESRQPFPRE